MNLRSRFGRMRGFSLVELLLVCVVIVGLLAAIRPAIRGLTQTSGRKGAVSMLLSGVEQTRATAIEQGISAYLVIAKMPDGPEAALDRERYHFKAFAICVDPPSGNLADPLKQLTAWKPLPVGFAAQPLASPSAWPTKKLKFVLNGSSGPSDMEVFCPTLKFGPTGEIEEPESGDLLLKIFAGFVDAQGAPHRTGAATAIDQIRIYRFTGRPRYETN